MTGTGLLGAVTIAYLGVAASYYAAGRDGMALAFVGYAVANLGFLWDLR